ncbi:serine hydrolase [Dyella telluris]|uniref:Serine hydrolase n=1 Tax=Dyella telluris TaxID=2763498 RepID=A0A7G8Q8J4_9GAMM|nr:serine hydrolase [Dyella telluris]QNK03102.1 serine hydrolase [Dyella telluris]
MKRMWLALGLSFATACAAADASLLPQRVDEAARQYIQAGEYPVLVIGVVDGDRSAVYAYGKLDNGQKPAGDTAFEIGSITKTFTATLLAQQVTEGKLQLDTPVASLLPGFTIPSRDGKQITLGNLASQNSGLPRLPGNLRVAGGKDPYADYDADKLKAFLASYTLPRDPGASYEYSNLGVGLLGYALGVHAGTDYAKLLQEQLLKPLGMTHSTADLDAAIRAGLARGHDSAGQTTPNWHIGVLGGAGAIVSTADDMLRYLKANMGVVKTPLYPAMELAQKPAAAGPKASARLGLVWMIHHINGGDLIEHGGMTGGFASYVGFTADRRHGVVVLTNRALEVGELGQAVLQPEAPLTPPHKQVAMSTKQLDEYAGGYVLHPGFVLTVFRKDDQLMAQATGQSAFPVFPEAKDEFFANSSDISLSFTRDDHGKVSGMVLHQHGDYPAPRLASGSLPTSEGKTVELDATTLSSYAGHYQLSPKAVVTIAARDGQAFIQLTGQPEFPIYASARDKFFLRVVDAKVDFERDAQGKVNALVIHQNNTDHRAPRVAE